MNYNGSNSNNFARTCSRLSQFLEERRRRRSVGDQSCFAFPHMSPPPSSKSDSQRVEEEIAEMVTRSLLPKNMEKEDTLSASEAGPGEFLNSLNLFPLTSPSAKEESPQTVRELPRPTEEPKTRTASLTIFYAGKVLVFDEFPEDKAQEVISLATQGIIRKCTNPETSIETQTQPQTLASSSSNNMVGTQDKQDIVSAQEAGGLSDLPIARRTSLFRFIEKRKDRVASAAPYQMKNNSSTATVNSNPQRYNAVMRDLCQQHQEEQKQNRLLELKL